MKPLPGRRAALNLVLALALPLAACTKEKTCPAGETLCGDACTSLAIDSLNCGACGVSCGALQACDSGACRAGSADAPDVYVACFATDDVRPVTAALRPGLARKAGDGPLALATAGGRVYAASSLSHSLSSFAPDLGDARELLLAGDDFEALTAHGGRLFVSSAGTGTLVVWDPASARVVDEVVLGDRSGVNPRGVDFVGERAYVALYGTNASSGGQEVVAVDFSGLAACASPPCGTVARRVSLLALADAGGLPFPSAVLARGGLVYVTLANLKLGAAGFYTDPAGDGKLAVLDTLHGDAVSHVDLAGCTNPGALALAGDVLWVACGGSASLVPVDLSTGAPLPGAPVDVASVGVFAPGKLAFCGGSGYVTDQWSGSVVRFDPLGQAAPASAEICPLSDAGWAWAADVACAP